MAPEEIISEEQRSIALWEISFDQMTGVCQRAKVFLFIPLVLWVGFGTMVDGTQRDLFRIKIMCYMIGNLDILIEYQLN